MDTLRVIVLSPKVDYGHISLSGTNQPRCVVCLCLDHGLKKSSTRSGEVEAYYGAFVHHSSTKTPDSSRDLDSQGDAGSTRKYIDLRFVRFFGSLPLILIVGTVGFAIYCNTVTPFEK